MYFGAVKILQNIDVVINGDLFAILLFIVFHLPTDLPTKVTFQGVVSAKNRRTSVTLLTPSEFP